jgi:uncharacterized protein YutD
MQISQQQVEKLLKGNHSFSMWSFAILVTRLKQLYGKDPTTDVLDSCVTELNAFIKKFCKFMGRDYTTIEKL